jgi:hypothetical protein
MSEHNLFYYPYASFADQQLPLLKVAVLYFDKLFILDPTMASWGTIGPGDLERDLRLLEDEHLLERISPLTLLHQNEQTVIDAIDSDLKDPEFLALCADKKDTRWTLALSKVPKSLRDLPDYQPIDASAKLMMTRAGTYVEGIVYDEYRESQSGAVEYRYIDLPFTVGEAVMLNHALVGSLLHSNAVPITDDNLHTRIMNYKLQKAQQVPAIQAVLETRRAQLQFSHAKAAVQALTDLDLGIIPDQLSLEDILTYRNKYGGELQAAREKLTWMVRTMTEMPWTKDFEDEVFHKFIPDLHEALEPAKASWASWSKVGGIVLGGTAVALGLFGSPLTPVAVGVAALTIGKDVGLGGLEWYQDWKKGKTQNGLHYLIRLKRK